MKKEGLKGKILLFSIITLCISLIGYGSLAYFTTEGQSTNVITMGNIEIEVVEKMLDENGQIAEYQDQIGVLPSQSVSKIAMVENTGEQTAWIRVKVEKIINLVDPSSGQVDDSLISIDFNQTDWTYKDGYYYYNEPLNMSELTEPLFTTVNFDKKMGNIYQDAEVLIVIKAYATQKANNGQSVFEASGWPSEN